MARAPWDWAAPEARGVHYWLDPTGVYYKYAPGQDPNAQPGVAGETTPRLPTAGTPSPKTYGGDVPGTQDIMPPTWGLELPPTFGTGGFSNFSPTPGVGEGGGYAQMPTNIRGGGGDTGGAEKNQSGQGPGGGARAAVGAPTSITGAKSPQDQMTQAQNRDFFNRIMAMLLQGGGAAFTPAAVPDFRADAMRQAELMRHRAGQRGAEEAAATGGAGSRDLAYRQSLLDEALFNAGGQIGAEQSGRQFQANLQAKSLEAQQEIARFNQLLKALSVLNSMQ